MQPPSNGGSPAFQPAGISSSSSAAPFGADPSSLPAAVAGAGMNGGSGDTGGGGGGNGSAFNSLGSIDVESVSQSPPAAEPSATAIYLAATGRKVRRRGPWHSRAAAAAPPSGALLLQPKGRKAARRRQADAAAGQQQHSAWGSFAEGVRDQGGSGAAEDEDDFEIFEERARTGAQASTSASSDAAHAMAGAPSPIAVPLDLELAAALGAAPAAPPPAAAFNFRDAPFECAVTRAVGAAPDWFVVRRLFERWQGRLNPVQLAAMLCRLAELSGAAGRHLLRSEAGALRRFVGALLLEARGALPAADAATGAAMLRGLALLQKGGKVGWLVLVGRLGAVSGCRGLRCLLVDAADA